MTELGERILAEAREWLGTPWHHNQCCKGAGVDCARFYQGILKNACGIEFELENYSRKAVNGSLLRQIRAVPRLNELIIPIERQAGDLLVFFVGREPGHCGICNGEGMIHADQGKGSVVEIPDLGQAWRSRLCAAFRVTA